MSKAVDSLASISFAPAKEGEAYTHWIAQADIVDYLVDSEGAEDWIIYASLGCTFLHGVLVPNKLLQPLPVDELLRWNGNPYMSSWGVSFGFGKGAQATLSPPLSSFGSEAISRGEQLVFAHGSFGGWSPFGPARKVTRCANNVLFELDGESALEVYKRYLGEHAKGLPASGLLFPFAMLGKDHSEVGLIRTILGVDEANGSLTLAGDIDPEGYLRLMHASTDALVEGAEAAAEAAQAMRGNAGEGLALLVSCVGRKLVMGGRVDEEVEAVGDVFGQGATLAGFYSYGEISPFSPSVDCKLHNQTMTITYLSETA